MLIALHQRVSLVERKPHLDHPNRGDTSADACTTVRDFGWLIMIVRHLIPAVQDEDQVPSIQYESLSIDDWCKLQCRIDSLHKDHDFFEYTPL